MATVNPVPRPGRCGREVSSDLLVLDGEVEVLDDQAVSNLYLVGEGNASAVRALPMYITFEAAPGQVWLAAVASAVRALWEVIAAPR